MENLDDEFRFITSDAARVGRTSPLPRIARRYTPLADGRQVSALRYDTEHTPQFTFLHGAGLNAHSYDPTALALDAPALSLDLPGHGRSDWRTDADYHPQQLARDIAEALPQLVSTPTVLVGHSLGGLTATLLAAAHPERFRELIILDISPGIVPSRSANSVNEFITGQRDFATHEEIIDRAITFGIGTNRTKLARGIALNTRLRPDGRWEWTHHLAHLTKLPAHADAPARPYEALWEALDTVIAAGIPVTLVAASNGMVTPDLVDEWAHRLPKSHTTTLTGSHNLHESAPVELAHLLRSTQRLTPPGPGSAHTPQL